MKKIVKLFGCVTMAILFLTAISLATEKVYFYHTDAAGTPVAMTDASGNVVWRADYKPFGEEQAVTPLPENNKRFIGKEKDEETGLYYFGARYMDACIGRFTSPDPVGISEKDLLNPQRLNRYNYGLNNPYRYVDPDGEFPLDTVWDIGNVLYDIYKRDWTSLGADAACMMIPYVPAGITKVTKVIDKIDDVVDVSKTVKTSDKLYHYTGADPSKIAKEGLQPGASGKVFTTPEGGLSPLQAQIDLALPPNRGLPNHLIEIDIPTLKRMGINVPAGSQVGRSFNMPGGGTEMIFPHALPPEAIKVIK